MKKLKMGTSLAVQWLILHVPNAGGVGLIPGQGTKIPHVAQCLENKQTTKKKKKKKNLDKLGKIQPLSIENRVFMGPGLT